MQPKSNQTNNNFGVTLCRDARVDRFVKLPSGFILPMGIAACGAGKDAWMRNIVAGCTGCRQKQKISHLNDGGYCEECAAEGIDD
jgi:hypothetical protein